MSSFAMNSLVGCCHHRNFTVMRSLFSSEVIAARLLAEEVLNMSILVANDVLLSALQPMATKKCLESKLKSCKGKMGESVQPRHRSAGALL